MTPPAGVSYGAQGLVNWDKTVEPQPDKTQGADLPLWCKAMFMPAGKQMSNLANFMNSIDFWRLRPQPKALATQPGDQSPRRFITAASWEPSNLSVVYVPEDRTFEVSRDALPSSPSFAWLNPRTGQDNRFVPVAGGRSGQVRTPDPGDWLLVIKARK